MKEIMLKNIPATLDLAYLFASVVNAYDLDLIPQIVPDGIGASDHASFWAYGYPAILGIEDHTGGDFNDYYHTTDDTINHLNEISIRARTLEAGTFTFFTIRSASSNRPRTAYCSAIQPLGSY